MNYSGPADVLVMMASYADHGLAGKPYSSLSGHDIIVLHGK